MAKGLIGLLIALALVGFLMAGSTEKTESDMEALDVAAGNVSYGEGDGSGDMLSPEPFVHCYGVPDPGKLDMKTRMDFEARTSKGWVPAPDAATEGRFCLRESQHAIDKRIAEARKAAGSE